MWWNLGQRNAWPGPCALEGKGVFCVWKELCMAMGITDNNQQPTTNNNNNNNNHNNHNNNHNEKPSETTILSMVSSTTTAMTMMMMRMMMMMMVDWLNMKWPDLTVIVSEISSLEKVRNHEILHLWYLVACLHNQSSIYLTSHSTKRKHLQPSPL